MQNLSICFSRFPEFHILPTSQTVDESRAGRKAGSAVEAELTASGYLPLWFFGTTTATVLMVALPAASLASTVIV